MFNHLKRIHFFLTFILLSGTLAHAADEAYMEVVRGRAAKIVDNIELGDNAPKRDRIIETIARQYADLNDLHETRDKAIKAVKEAPGEDETDTFEAAAQTIRESTEKQVRDLHFAYLGRLGSLLTPAQVDAVKDGMTYGVAPNTYQVYMDMIPDLDEEQRARIKAWLLEAREHAMDGGSSDEKHRWFGKYKGRINNYLSDLGYDLKEAERQMWERIKAEGNGN